MSAIKFVLIFEAPDGAQVSLQLHKSPPKGQTISLVPEQGKAEAFIGAGEYTLTWWIRTEPGKEYKVGIAKPSGMAEQPETFTVDGSGVDLGAYLIIAP